MKKILTLFPFLILLFACGQPSVQKNNSAYDEAFMAEYLTDSTVGLVKETSKRGEYAIYCSGEFLSPNRVLTAAHCIGNKNLVLVSTASQLDEDTLTFTSYRVYELEKIDEDRDLALLKFADEEKPQVKHSFLSLANKSPEKGEVLYAVGNPAGANFSFSKGNVAHPSRLFNGTKFMQGTVYVWYGSSGGPVVNKHGALVGVVSWGLRGTDNLNMFVHLEEVKAFLRMKQRL